MEAEVSLLNFIFNFALLTDYVFNSPLTNPFSIIIYQGSGKEVFSTVNFKGRPLDPLWKRLPLYKSFCKLAHVCQTSFLQVVLQRHASSSASNFCLLWAIWKQTMKEYACKNAQIWIMASVHKLELADLAWTTRVDCVLAWWPCLHCLFALPAWMNKSTLLALHACKKVSSASMHGACNGFVKSIDYLGYIKKLCWFIFFNIFVLLRVSWTQTWY